MSTTTSFSREHGVTPGDSSFKETKDVDFEAIQRSPEFTEVRRRLLRFTFPASVFFLCWYLAYVLLAAYAHDFMSQQVFGRVTIGLLLGLSQFVTTVVIMIAYVTFARRKIDPHTAELRDKAGAER